MLVMDSETLCNTAGQLKSPGRKLCLNSTAHNRNDCAGTSLYNNTGERFDVPVVIKFRRNALPSSLSFGGLHSEQDRRLMVTAFLMTDKDDFTGGSSSSTATRYTIQLTDEADPFFLFFIRLNEEQFIRLKADQNLLLEYHSFATFVRDLLNKILQESQNDTPKHYIELIMPSMPNNTNIADCAPDAVAELHFVETNVYKRIIHLALEMRKASDAELKAYLAACLRQTKHEREVAESKLNQRLQAAEQRAADNEQHLNMVQRESEKLKCDTASSAADLLERQSQELSHERERCNQLVRDMQVKFEEDTRDVERNHAKKIWTMEDRVKELEQRNQSLQQKVSTLESSAQEKKIKIASLNEERDNLNQFLNAQKRRIGELELRERELEQNVQQTSMRAAALDQEATEKKRLIDRLQSDVDATKHEHQQLVQQLDERHRNNRQLSRHLVQCKNETEKANEIIAKLQFTTRQLEGKCSMLSEIAVRQEEVVQKRDAELQNVRTELNQALTQGEKLTNDLTLATDKLGDTRTKLNDAEKLLQVNETTINYLNKKLTIAEESVRAPFLPSSSNFDGMNGESAFRSTAHANRDAFLPPGGARKSAGSIAESASRHTGSNGHSNSAARIESAYFPARPSVML